MLSIIIISKNEEHYLPALLESIKNQAGIRKKDYELILSDAQSTDKTREIAKRYGCRIIEGGLPSVGRNNGAKASRYENLLFLDSDIILPPDFLLNLEKVFERGIECGSPRILPVTNDLFIKFIYGFYNKFAILMQHILPFSGGMCLFSTKRLFYKIHGFNEKMLLSEDHDYVTKAAKFGKFSIVKDLHIYCDVRRIEIEGKSQFVYKYLKGGVYRMLWKNRIEPPFEYVLHGSDESVTKIYERIK